MGVVIDGLGLLLLTGGLSTNPVQWVHRELGWDLLLLSHGFLINTFSHVNWGKLIKARIGGRWHKNSIVVVIFPPFESRLFCVDTVEMGASLMVNFLEKIHKFI